MSSRAEASPTLGNETRFDRRTFLQYAALTTGSAAASWWGLDQWTNPPSAVHPNTQELAAINSQLRELTQELRDSGAIAPSGFLDTSWEFRKPFDPRLDQWGELKNQADKLARKISEDIKEREKFQWWLPILRPLRPLSALVGPILTIEGLAGMFGSITGRAKPLIPPRGNQETPRA